MLYVEIDAEIDAVQTWNPHLQGEIDKFERVQIRATRIPFGFEQLVYEEGLKILCLTCLKDRRLRGDLIEMYKVMSNRESINWVKPLDLRKNVDISGPAESVCGNSLRMRRDYFSSRIRNSVCSWATIRDNIFVNTVVQTWNSFPKIALKIVTSPSIYPFKTSIDENLKSLGFYNF